MKYAAAAILTSFILFAPLFCLADGFSMSDLAAYGLLIFLLGIFLLFVGFIMILIKSVRKIGGYCMLSGFLCLLIGFGICTKS